MDKIRLYCWKHDAEYRMDGTWCETRCLDTECTYCALRPAVHHEGCACKRHFCCMCWEEIENPVMVQDGDDLCAMCLTCSQESAPAL